MTPEKLVDIAKKAMEKAYAPYSGYRVGAALLCEDGTVYSGCNIENASFSPTICAERTAFAKAISEGHREFSAIAICGGKDGIAEGIFPPCGVCRQVMGEFCGPDFKIYMVGPGETYQEQTLRQLLPYGFCAEEHMNSSQSKKTC